jgi:carbon-monoxide dehydrogenase large subunit
LTLSVTTPKRIEDAPEGRVEDKRLLTGRGRFVDDLKLEGQAYMGLVRSPYAHAKINSIDFSKARSSPDFIDSLTGEDLLKEGVQPLSQNPWPFQKRAKRYHLAVGKARFAGEPVAAILVRNKNSIEDLIELVEVDYESLPAVTTIEQSKRGKAMIYEDWGDNISLTSEVKKGDAEKAIASAAFVIHAKEGIARQVAAPIEPHAVLVAYDTKQDVYEVWATVQSVHGTRDKLSSELKKPKEKFHVRVMDMGGGFGSKGAQSYPEAPLACIFSKRTGLPVKWTATRSEEFLESAAGRDEYCDITLACDESGRIVAIKASVECDSGVTGSQAHMPTMTIETMPGPYRIPNQDITVAAYVTNKMPLGPVRGAGGPEGCYFIERAVDVLAKKVGLDPIEFRRRNVLRKTGPAEGEADFGLLLDALVKSSDYEALSRWRSDLYSKFRQQGPSNSSLIAGLGVSVTGSDESDEEDEEEWSGGSSGGSGGAGAESKPWQTGGSSGGGAGERWAGQPSGEAKAARPAGGPEKTGLWQNSGELAEKRTLPGASEETLGFMSETARVTLDKNGKVKVYTGSSPHGQGEETTFAQLASEELGVPLENVTVVWGDTTLIPKGIGTYGSRSAATGGSAVVDASRKLKAQLLARASEALAVDANSLEMRGGGFVSASRPDAVLATLIDVLVKQGTDEVSSSSVFTLNGMSYSSGVHLCALTLDVELGKVKVVKYVVVEDCGRMINKTIVEGQLHGGVLHGVGGALFERLAYDEEGNLLSSTFMDYNIATALDSPDVLVFHETTPSTVTLDGAKGVGESGTNGSYAAVINALNDALSQLGTGKELSMVPATPDAIFRTLNASAAKVAD